MLKILTVLGARPQFIKAAALSRAIKEYSKIEEIIVHTGQHYDSNMSDIFFEEMEIPKPKYMLHTGGKTHGAMTGQQLEKIEEILLIENPNLVLVYGDTNSTLAGALAAAKLHIPVAHVEAGLRSFNMEMPEEVNRIITDRISRILFCPTQAAVDNLNKEGYPFIFADGQQYIEKVGDVMQDCAELFASRAIMPTGFNLKQGFILATIHRAENTDSPERLKDIIEALNETALTTSVILPLHPRTKNIIVKLKLNTDNLTIIDPVGYLEMLWLLKHCGLVITDSGGVQKEAFFMGKYCVTMRDQTEWVELIEVGANELVGADKNKILDAVKRNLLREVKDKDQLYGGGIAAKRIVEVLKNILGDGDVK